jgi:chemotaxis protein methyltransferase CheR
MAIATADFEFVCKLVDQRTGIVLDKGKEYLVESRLAPLAAREGLASLDLLVARLRKPGADPLARKVCDAMTTNETSFFRDLHPFETLRRTVLPDLIERRKATRQLSFWCAAASTGQESYSVLMTLLEHFPQLADWKVSFVATDICGEVLAKARAGRFTQLEVNRGLPAALLVKYFRKEGADWELISDVRKRVDFRELNLTTAWPAMPAADVVFMRNVLIYFSIETKKQILAKARRVMKDDGYLFLGGAETTLNLDEAYERVQLEKGSIYRKAARPALAAAA